MEYVKLGNPRTPLTLFGKPLKFSLRGEFLYSEDGFRVAGSDEFGFKVTHHDSNLSAEATTLAASEMAMIERIQQSYYWASQLLEATSKFCLQKKQEQEDALRAVEDAKDAAFLAMNTSGKALELQRLFMSTMRHKKPNGDFVFSSKMRYLRDERDRLLRYNGHQLANHVGRLMRFEKNQPVPTGVELDKRIVQALKGLLRWLDWDPKKGTP